MKIWNYWKVVIRYPDYKHDKLDLVVVIHFNLQTGLVKSWPFENILLLPVELTFVTISSYTYNYTSNLSSRWLLTIVVLMPLIARIHSLSMVHFYYILRFFKNLYVELYVVLLNVVYPSIYVFLSKITCIWQFSIMFILYEIQCRAFCTPE